MQHRTFELSNDINEPASSASRMTVSSIISHVDWSEALVGGRSETVTVLLVFSPDWYRVGAHTIFRMHDSQIEQVA